MKPKKSLGQNFLTNKKAIFEIVSVRQTMESHILSNQEYVPW